jgi:C-terminal processing protease CtpA/Prc
MQAFMKSTWQRRMAALSLGGLLTATPLLAQSTIPEIPPLPTNSPAAQLPTTPPTATPPAATPPAAVPPAAVPQPRAQPTLDNARPGLRDALDRNRATREANRDNRQDAREQNRDSREDARDQNRDNRELNRDIRANSVEPAERRDRVRERLGFALNAAANGLAIANIQQNSAFGTAGFRNNDVILRVGDRRFTNNAAFYTWLNTVQPGQPVAIVVQRGGREETINWTPTEQWTREYNADYQDHVSANSGTLGITLDAHQPQAAIVVEVAPGSLADRAGIRPRDQIDSLNGEKIRNAKEFHAWAGRLDGQDKVDLGFTRVVTLTSAAKPVTNITIPLPEGRDAPATLPMPITPRSPQPNVPRLDPAQANPGVTPPAPR